jgi:hypothetical protein
MTLLDLPLECFRHVMLFVAEGTAMRDLIHLRLVNRMQHPHLGASKTSITLQAD